MERESERESGRVSKSGGGGVRKFFYNTSKKDKFKGNFI